jgi:hypothetical protein
VTIAASRITVGTTAVQLIAAASTNLEGWISVPTSDGDDAIYLGPSNAVTTATGFRFENGDALLRMNLTSTDAVWAISAGLVPVSVLVRAT